MSHKDANPVTLEGNSDVKSDLAVGTLIHICMKPFLGIFQSCQTALKSSKHLILYSHTIMYGILTYTYIYHILPLKIKKQNVDKYTIYPMGIAINHHRFFQLYRPRVVKGGYLGAFGERH